eukprot:gi/632961646/ref/XP_007896876.1/ PREDICTED: uncharacterized protein LOC103181906 isoform X2 [Callorhinchus milii]
MSTGGSESDEVGPGQVEEKCPATGASSFLTYLGKLNQFGPLQYMFYVVQRLLRWAKHSAQEESMNLSIPGTYKTKRRLVKGKKRLGRMAQFLVAIAPLRLQKALGFPMVCDLGQSEISEDLRQSPNKPTGTGGKRKQDDLDEEEISWIECLSSELPEDSVDDPTYEPSKSSSKSDEHFECDPESDLEVEQTSDPNLVMLKETPLTVEKNREPEILQNRSQEEGGKNVATHNNLERREHSAD